MIDFNELDNIIGNSLYPNGACPYFNSCKEDFDCLSPLCFYRVRVGNNYYESKVKILIVGQEDVRPKDGSTKIYRVCEPSTLDGAGYNEHYLKTFYTVAQLLLDEKDLPKGFQKSDLDSEKYEKLNECFAQTNYFKCVFSDSTNRSDKMHTKMMERNCSNLLIKEIKMLQPDVVIIQGKNHDEFWDSISYEQIDSRKINAGNRNYELGIYSTIDFGKTTYIIDSYHPTSHGIWEKVLDCFLDFINETIELLNMK